MSDLILKIVLIVGGLVTFAAWLSILWPRDDNGTDADGP